MKIVGLIILVFAQLCFANDKIQDAIKEEFARNLDMQEFIKMARESKVEVWLQGQTADALIRTIDQENLPVIRRPKRLMDFLTLNETIRILVKGKPENIIVFKANLESDLFRKVDIETGKSKWNVTAISQSPNTDLPYPLVNLTCEGCNTVSKNYLEFYRNNEIEESKKISSADMVNVLTELKAEAQKNTFALSDDLVHRVRILMSRAIFGEFDQRDLMQIHEVMTTIQELSNRGQNGMTNIYIDRLIRQARFRYHLNSIDTVLDKNLNQGSKVLDFFKLMNPNSCAKFFKN